MFTLFIINVFVHSKKNIVSQSVKSTFLITFFVMTTLCFCHVWINLPNGPSSINLLSLPLSLIGPAIYFLIGRKGKALIPLYISGWIFSIAVHLGSNNGFIHSVYPLILCSIAVICYVGEYVKNEKRYRFIKNTMGIIGSLVLMLIVISTVYLRLSYVYRDESIPNLTTRMEIGPAKGIYTTDESALKYKEIIHAINDYTPDDGTILYTKLLPFGYLTKNLRPGTPSVWRTPANSPRLAQYYHLYPELKPSCVFVLDKDYGISNDSNIIDGELSIILNERDYRMIRLECCTIYLKNEEEGV